MAPDSDAASSGAKRWCSIPVHQSRCWTKSLQLMGRRHQRHGPPVRILSRSVALRVARSPLIWPEIWPEIWRTKWRPRWRTKWRPRWRTKCARRERVRMARCGCWHTLVWAQQPRRWMACPPFPHPSRPDIGEGAKRTDSEPPLGKAKRVSRQHVPSARVAERRFVAFVRAAYFNASWMR